MDNFNNGNMYPEMRQDWQSLSTPVIKTEPESDFNDSLESNASPSEKRHSKHPVLTLQLILVLCVLLFLFALKFLSPPFFESVMTFYEAQISKSVLINGDFESLNYASLFASDDEA